MRVSALEGHRAWAPFYDRSANPILALERRTMACLLEPIHPERVIDVACGTGRWLVHLQDSGASVFGVDYCQEMLAEAMRVPSLWGRLVLGDVEQLPFRSASADLVLCSLALGYFPDMPGVFREFARVTAEGGHIAMSDIHPAAIQAGWTRSFAVGEVHYEMEHYFRTLEEIDKAASDAGLRIGEAETAYLGEPEYRLFEACGRADRFQEVRQTPALFLRVWEKPC